VPGNDGKELAPGTLTSPDVSGCVAVGDTEQETRRNFQEALVAHFDAMREVGEPIPEPHTLVDYVEGAA
jgi:predicted RNase H-like HicB family nuclease